MPVTLEEIQDDILDRVHAGESIDEAAVLAQYPEHADDLRGFFTVLALVEGSSADPTIPPTTLGEYRIIHEIGRGGMGVVYAAEQTSLKRKVALKILPPMLRMDVRLIARFQREAEAAGRLRHPGIVPVYAVGEAAGTPFFAMELVEGTSLRHVLDARKAGDDAGLPTDELAWQAWAANAAADVADALANAHEEGILHRDIKPANILLDNDGAVRLTDFGLAQDLRSPGLTQTGEVFGSPQYMSPEQAIRRDLPVDGRSDVYSLAVTLYELLTHALPYGGTTNAEILTALTSGNVIPPRQINAEVSRPLESVLMRALRLKPGDRYANAAAFAKDLRAAVQGETTVASRHVTVAESRGRLLAIGGVLALLAGLGIWLWGNEKDATPSAKTGSVARSEAVEGEPPAGDPSADDPSVPVPVPVRVEFEFELPADLPYREHSFLRAVQAATDRGGIDADDREEHLIAQEAWSKTKSHLAQLESDVATRLCDEALARLDQNPRIAPLYRQVQYRDPYLICCLSREPLSRFDTLALSSRAKRKQARAMVPERSRAANTLIDVHASVLTRLFPETTAHYELGENGVSLKAGALPLVVVLFDDVDTYATTLGAERFRSGHLDQSSGVLYAVSPDEGGNAGWAVKLTHGAIQQVERLFTGARATKWNPENWFSAGWAEYWGAVQAKRIGAVPRSGLSRLRLLGMQGTSKQLKAVGRTYPVFTLQQLTSFVSFAEIRHWGATEWKLDMGLSLYLQQCWALMYLLHESEDETFRGMGKKIVELGMTESPADAFRIAFNLNDNDPRWETLNTAFRSHVSVLLNRKGAPPPHVLAKATSAVAMTFDLTRPTSASGPADDDRLADLVAHTLDVLRMRLRAKSFFLSFRSISTSRVEISFKRLTPTQRVEVLDLIGKPRDIEFRIEVLPDERYRRVIDPPKRTGLWQGDAASFHAFKSAEVVLWQRAAQSAQPYIPARPRYRLVPKFEADGDDVEDFRIVEVPEDKHRFDDRMLENAAVGQSYTRHPVVNFDVQPAWQARFKRWTAANQGLPLAILIEGTYYAAPVINAPLSSSVQITMGGRSSSLDESDAKRLTTLLQWASLRLTPTLVALDVK